jgi:carbamoyl-phosphate synthase large subunit
MYKAILASNFKFPSRGSGILMTVKDSDKPDLVPLADKLNRMGFELFGTGGTANYLNKYGIPCSFSRKIEEGEPNVLELINDGRVKMLVNTEKPNSQAPGCNGMKLRRHAIEHGVATITSLDTLVAVVDCLQENLSPADLKPCEIREFTEIVKKTRKNTLPILEMPLQNDMLKK